MPFTTMSSLFSIGEKVILDGNEEMTCVVIGILVRKGLQQIEVSWINNGALQTAWVDDWRLTTAESKDG